MAWQRYRRASLKQPTYVGSINNFELNTTGDFQRGDGRLDVAVEMPKAHRNLDE